MGRKATSPLCPPAKSQPRVLCVKCGNQESSKQDPGHRKKKTRRMLFCMCFSLDLKVISSHMVVHVCIRAHLNKGSNADNF